MVQIDKFNELWPLDTWRRGTGPPTFPRTWRLQPAVGWRRSSNFGDFLRLLRPDKEDVARNKREEQERRGDRRVYSHEEYIGLVLRSGSMISHFYVICVCVGRGGLENKDYNLLKYLIFFLRLFGR